MTIHPEAVAPTMTATGNPYLEGPYQPVTEEVTAVDLPVIFGKLPVDIDGIYVRNGPNPQFSPIGRYHYFDGDGMVHAVHFSNGRATYRNRYVRTAEYVRESGAGRALWSGIIEPFTQNPPGDRRERNAANTDVLFHHGNLLATWYRASKPQALDPLTLASRGEDDFHGTLQGEVSAHAKVDEHSEELMFFDYGINSPFLRYGVVDPSGRVGHFTTLDIPAPRLPHDMAITEHHSILMDLPLYNDPAAAQAGRFRLFFDRELPARFAVLPRHGSGDQARWFEAAPAYIYHVVNAWEEGQTIVMVVCRVTKPTPVTDHGHPLAQLLAYMRPEAQLHKYRFDLGDGTCRERPLDDVNTEFPAIHQGRTGRPSRWSYNMRLKVDQTLLFDALLRYDLETGSTAKHEFGPGRYGSEVVFIPRDGATAEDDGYLSMYCYDAASDRSEVWIYEAADIEAGPICMLQVPVRVPLGFHATWISDERQRADSLRLQ
jgi:carotenoid cleavage dioxygenase